ACHPRRRAAAVGLCVHLCAADGAGDRGADHLGLDRRRGQLMDNLLSIITFLPAVAAVILALFLRGDDAAARHNARWLALIATLATFGVSLVMLFQFQPGAEGFQFVEERQWISGMTYRVGVDGISLTLVMLTTFVMPLVILAAWNVDQRAKD